MCIRNPFNTIGLIRQYKKDLQEYLVDQENFIGYQRDEILQCDRNVLRSDKRLIFDSLMIWFFTIAAVWILCDHWIRVMM
jgi:hypothetical protein